MISVKLTRTTHCPESPASSHSVGHLRSVPASHHMSCYSTVFIFYRGQFIPPGVVAILFLFFFFTQWHQYFLSKKFQSSDNANTSHSLFFIPKCSLIHIFHPSLVFVFAAVDLFSILCLILSYWFLSLIISLFALVSVSASQLCMCCMCFVQRVVRLSGGGSTYL